MTRRNHQKESLLRPRDYENFRDPIEKILNESQEPLTWTEIKEKERFQQRAPNNKWVKWMEEDIGLVRQKTKDGKTLWRLAQCQI